MASSVSYPLNASSGPIDPAWAQDQYGWAYEVLSASGVGDDDSRWKFTVTEYGLHPLTYHGWWVFVVYYDKRLGVVLNSDHLDSLRGAFPETAIEVCGRSINGLFWVLLDSQTIPLERIQLALDRSIKTLQSGEASYPRGSQDALVLLWNPDNWDWRALKEQIGKSRTGQPVTESWKVRYPNQVHVGMPVYIYRTGNQARGFMASGSVVSPPYVTSHFRQDGAQQFSVDVMLDTIIDTASDLLLSMEALNTGLPDAERVSNFLYSGVVLRGVAAKQLQTLWRNHIGMTLGVGSEPGALPDASAEHFYAEGALRQLSLNVHERSGSARERAIALHGTECCVCGISFERVYGDIGKGFIHIHHLDPIANAATNRQVDPRCDLVPVCPNCHAMLHRRPDHPFSPDELRQMMRG